MPAAGHNRSYKQPKDCIATDRFTRYCGHRPSTVRGVEIPKAAPRCLSMPKPRRSSAAHDVERALLAEIRRPCNTWVSSAKGANRFRKLVGEGEAEPHRLPVVTQPGTKPGQWLRRLQAASARLALGSFNDRLLRACSRAIEQASIEEGEEEVRPCD